MNTALRSGGDNAATLFAQSLQLFKPSATLAQEDDPMLDISDGLAARFRQVCEDRMVELSGPSVAPLSSVNSQKLWALEKDTWDLVGDLYLSRASPLIDGLTPHDVITKNPYTPETALIRQCMDCSQTLNELLIARNWLQRNAPPPVPPERRKSYWRFTKLELMHQLRSKGAPSHRQPIRGLVKELDPDAVTRSAIHGAEPSVLEPKDAEFEKALSQRLYTYIRAGDIETAIDICKVVDQPWRSAAMRGAHSFSWQFLETSAEEPDDTAMDEDAALMEGCRGNIRRKLWRKSCQTAARSSTLPSTSRTLLAALAPSLATLPTLLPALRTWEDHLWARVSALLEERVDALLGHYQSFWIKLDESGWNTPRSDQLEEDDNTSMYSAAHDEFSEESFRHDIHSSLAEMKNISLHDQFDYRNHFHRAQYSIIMEDTDRLFTEISEELRNNPSLDLPPSDLHQTLRFFAHICLFLRHIGRRTPPEATDVIIQTYIAQLEAQERGDLVALYVGALGDNAIQRYALYLSNLPIELTKHDRYLALNRAKDHGLDIEAVAFSTAGLVAQQALENLPANTNVLPPVQDSSIHINPIELTLCRSIEWLTFHQSNFEHALRQTNAILRYLLGSGRLSVARDLLISLPSHVTSHAVSFDIEGVELVHFRRFFEVWDGWSDLGVVRNSEPQDPAQKFEALEWKKLYSATLDRVRELAEGLFTSGWLGHMEEDQIEDERRELECARIRQIFIPELVLRLHQELFISRRLFPGNLKHILRLTTVVADDRYVLYRDFITPDRNRLPEYLATVREASLAALEGGSKDPFAIIS
ncbi:nuclear pore protein 84/107 [Cantharellus anzutake]|uniref:nuclear pore protein 84/107 n=1 Tax=Cantharellus anzutake TaxID=1750568 RepID=UPI001907F6E5|nr:nuclear pore protein 84/107 [Cantharellus anzutake]KAF8324711.1 nuclear pore protein 84/107 [Cantharellus anzutake]